MKQFFRHRLALSALLAAAIITGACAPYAAIKSRISPAPAVSGDNPFLVESALPYHAPRFDLIRNGHYQAALEEGMRQQLAEIDAIAKQLQAPTFDNTIVPMEKSGALLTRTAKTFFGVVGANTNDTLQKVQEVEATKLAAHNDAIYLNDQLYRRVKGVYDQRNASNLSDEQKALIERYNRDFVRAGATLSEADKIRMRPLNQELSKLSTDFSNKLLAGTKVGALVVDNVSQLDGLTEAEIKTAADAAKQRGLTGKWVLPLRNTTQQPAQAELKNRAVRQRLFEQSTLRTSRSDSNDTRSTIRRMAELRAEKAQLLGYPTWAAYVLANQGAKTPENAIKLYGITFKERHDIPVYHPDVRTFEVFDADGSPLALIYFDYFKRDNKSGGAWMDQFVDQSSLTGWKPVVYNVANFTKPAAGQPALLTYDDVTTMFHEFGHGLHGMFSRVGYPTLSGTNVPRDFVEFPSQFNEHWALEPTVFANYAKHYQSGAPIPSALVDKIKQSRTFNQGFSMTELMAASLLDFAWHTLPAGASPQGRRFVGQVAGAAIGIFVRGR